MLFEFSPAVEGNLERTFKAHGHDRLDSWHLLEIVVDPDHQKRGMLLLRISSYAVDITNMP